MTQVDYAWIDIGAANFNGLGVAGATLRFEPGFRVTGSAYITQKAGEGFGEVGFSGFVMDGGFNKIGNDIFGTWVGVIDGVDVTEVDVSARVWFAHVHGGASVYLLWD